MTANNDSPVAATRHTHNDRVLGKERMREHLYSNAILPGVLHGLRNLSKEPLSRLLSSSRFREACVEGRVVLEILLDVLPVELGDEALDVLFVLELFWIGGLRFDGTHFGVEIGDVEEM